ncbi:GlxA family transcriptional regulator [Streptomyces xiamenensis]|uniref:GlxA family transcriptional regulator n=1 Tax=Streptomyces TaxID=1883 RepID=UPI001F1D3A63|nr:helix-turn-helix domain-containing protein [Streptomyces sp. NRRL F-2890]
MGTTEEARSVAILAVPRAYTLDIGIATHVFGRHPGYRVLVCAEGTEDADPDPGTPFAGTATGLGPAHPLSAAESADVVVVPGYDDPLLPLPSSYARTLRIATERGARMLAICTGVFALADIGALNGRTATTHWRHTAELRENYPEVGVAENRLFVEDGPFLTSAGAGAGIDACLHVVRGDFGAAVADGVTKDVVLPAARGAQEPQYVDGPVASREDLRATREWALAHLGSPLTVQGLAELSLLSRRTFIRRFARETGMPPMHWVAVQRILRARRLLETSGWTVERIARETGFGSAANFRTAFRRELGMTPSAYRAAHGGGQESGVPSRSTR